MIFESGKWLKFGKYRWLLGDCDIFEVGVWNQQHLELNRSAYYLMFNDIELGSNVALLIINL